MTKCLLFPVIPAKAGIQKNNFYLICWIPAFAGMTKIMPPLPTPNQDKEKKSDVTSDIEDVIIKFLIKSVILAPAGALLWSLKKSRDKKESGIDSFVKDLLPVDPTSPLDPKKFFLDSCSSCLVWLLGLILIVVIVLGIGGYACTIQNFNWCKAIASLVALFK